MPDRPGLIDSAGRSYLEFRRSLKPAYGRLWLQLAIADVGILAIVVVPIFVVGPLAPGPGVAVAVLTGAVLGFFEYVLALIGHASGHGDLSADRGHNDRIANVLIFPLTGLSVEEYRRVHLAHHRLLGYDGDPEDGYRERLDVRFFLRSLTGLRLLYAVRRHAGDPTDEPRMSAHNGWRSSRAVGGVLHLVAVLVPTALGCWWASLAWLLAFTIVGPTLSAVRLVLEHRPTRKDVYREGDATTRCFRGRVFASVFGAAGFRRHLLHHWDPQIHCTRLRDVERFLRDTAARPVLDAATSRYSTTFARVASD
jgi:fatty acid desaturase